MYLKSVKNRCENHITQISHIVEVSKHDNGFQKYDFLFNNTTFPMSDLSGLRDINNNNGPDFKAPSRRVDSP